MYVSIASDSIVVAVSVEVKVAAVIAIVFYLLAAVVDATMVKKEEGCKG